MQPIPQPLTLADQPRISDWFTRFPPEISEYTFTNLYAWQATRLVYHLVLEEALVFFVASPEDPAVLLLFGAPVGAREPAQLFAKLRNHIAGAVRVPAWAVPFCRDIGLAMTADRDNADYVYEVVDLAKLEGRRFAKKRNQIKHCLQHYDCRYEPLTRQNIDECLGMQENWCEIRGCKDEPGLDGEYAAIRETLVHYERLPLIGGVVKVDGVVSAYAIAERLNETTAVWHFEKAMPGIPGLGQLVNHWFTGHGLTDFHYVNREQDLGVPGLRQAKESYYPVRFVEKFRSGSVSNDSGG